MSSGMTKKCEIYELPWWAHWLSVFPEEDTGVPPCCRYRSCPLDHRNKYTNDNDCVRKGCFALPTSRPIVEATYWVGGTGSNTTSGQEYSMYVGLSSVEFVNCPYVSGFDPYGSECLRKSIKYSDPECLDGPVAFACDSCAGVTTSIYLTAVLACAALLFMIIGAQTRMRIKADCPCQKIINMIGEVANTLSLGFALYSFQSDCFENLHDAFNIPGVSTRFWVGPGLCCYIVCCASGAVRAIVHWLTPMPGHGATDCLELCSSTYWSRELAAYKKETDEEAAELDHHDDEYEKRRRSSVVELSSQPSLSEMPRLSTTAAEMGVPLEQGPLGQEALEQRAVGQGAATDTAPTMNVMHRSSD